MRHLVLLLALSPALAVAQPSIGLGADLVNRYVWRGFDFGESFSVQPTVSLNAGGFDAGAWGSYALTTAGANELDLFASYTAGAVTIGVTDYYFPSIPPDLGVQSGADYLNFADGGEGAHYIEPFVSVSGGDALPIALTVATVAYNDPAFSTYLEASYSTDVAGTEVGLALGSVLALDPEDGTEGSPFYGTTRNATVTNVSLSVARALQITEQFALPLFGAYTVNPETERAFLVFGVSL